MEPVKREDIFDLQTYSDKRAETRTHVMKVKDARRISLGPYLTFLFENRETIRYQIQEMVWIEKLSREPDIEHEIKTYNEILGGPGELGCTLLIEISEPDIRKYKLQELRNLCEHLYLVVESGEKVYAQYDPRQVSQERLSSVQYLVWNTQGKFPEKIGCDHPHYTYETVLEEEQKQALREDLHSELSSS